MAQDPWVEVLQLKFIATVVWQTLLFWLFVFTWYAAALPGHGSRTDLGFFTTWLGLLVLELATVAVLYTQRKLLSSSDVAPVYISRTGLTGTSWPSLFTSRCLLRNRRWSDLIDVAMLYGSCALCSILGSRVLQPRALTPTTGAVSQVPVLYGGTLGLLFAVAYLIRARTMLAYPILQRHRLFRLKLRLLSVLRSALVHATAALLVATLLAPVLAVPPPWAAPRAWLCAWRAGLLLAGLWSMGSTVLEVVFTEAQEVTAVAVSSSPAPAGNSSSGRDPTPGLIAALQHKDSLVQDWALQDLASLATSSSPAAAARRAAIFADDTGTVGWIPLVRYCMAEVEEACRVVAAACSQGTANAAAAGGGSSAGGGGKGAGGAARWNKLQLPTAGAAVRCKEQELAAWHLRSRYYRLSWAVQALSGLCAVSLSEDRCGVAQLSSPGLGDALLSLLSLAALLRTFNKQVAASSQAKGRLATLLQPLAAAMSWLLPGQHTATAGCLGGQAVPHVDVAASALLDATKLGVYRVSHTFGQVLVAVLRQGGGKPLAGGGDAVALLQGFLSGQE